MRWSYERFTTVNATGGQATNKHCLRWDNRVSADSCERRRQAGPALIPTIKELVRSTPVAEAEEFLRHVLGMKTAGQIRAYLTRHLHRLCPKLEMLDTKR